jgi:ketosteroid isomerase-like protein
MSKRLSWTPMAACIIAGLGTQHAMAAEPDLHNIEARLQAIEDRLSIEDVIGARYAKALDTSDPEGYASLFTEDAFLSVAGRPFKGRKEIRDMMRDIEKHHDQYDTRPATLPGLRWGPVRHVVTNPLITITGDTATSNSYSTEIGSNGRDEKQHGNPQSIMNVCRYEDNLVKQSGKWLISKRLITCDMFGKRSHAPDTYPQTMAPSDVSP